MSQWRQGTCRVTNGSQVVVFDDADLASAGIVGGELFSIDGSGVPYYLAGPPVSPGSPDQEEVTLTALYGGDTASGQAYAITQGQAPNHGLPYPEFGDVDTPTIVKAAIVRIDELLGNDIGDAAFAGRVLFTDADGNQTSEAALAYDAATDTLTVVNITATTATLSGTFTANGAVVLGNAAGDALTVAGSAVTWSGNPTHSGNHTFSGNVVVGGDTTLGDASGDALLIRSGAVSTPNMPAFLAYNSADDANVTGNGATVTVDFDTEVTDRGTNFATDAYTAPAQRPHSFSGAVRVMDLTTAMKVITVALVTSNRTYNFRQDVNVEANGDVWTVSFCVDAADLDAADTAFVQVTVGGGVGDTADIGGAASSLQTFFSGSMGS